jgi:hypothetical protein
MYSWIWHGLPGGQGARMVAAFLLLAGVAALLWFAAFPWAALHLPIDQAGIG